MSIELIVSCLISFAFGSFITIVFVIVFKKDHSKNNKLLMDELEESQKGVKLALSRFDDLGERIRNIGLQNG